MSKKDIFTIDCKFFIDFLIFETFTCLRAAQPSGPPTRRPPYKPSLSGPWFPQKKFQRALMFMIRKKWGKCCKRKIFKYLLGFSENDFLKLLHFRFSEWFLPEFQTSILNFPWKFLLGINLAWQTLILLKSKQNFFCSVRPLKFLTPRLSNIVRVWGSGFIKNFLNS